MFTKWWPIYLVAILSIVKSGIENNSIEVKPGVLLLFNVHTQSIVKETRLIPFTRKALRKSTAQSPYFYATLHFKDNKNNNQKNGKRKNNIHID